MTALPHNPFTDQPSSLFTYKHTTSSSSATRRHAVSCNAVPFITASVQAATCCWAGIGLRLACMRACSALAHTTLPHQMRVRVRPPLPRTRTHILFLHTPYPHTRPCAQCRAWHKPAINPLPHPPASPPTPDDDLPPNPQTKATLCCGARAPRRLLPVLRRQGPQGVWRGPPAVLFLPQVHGRHVLRAHGAAGHRAHRHQQPGRLVRARGRGAHDAGCVGRGVVFLGRRGRGGEGLGGASVGQEDSLEGVRRGRCGGTCSVAGV